MMLESSGVCLSIYFQNHAEAKYKNMHKIVYK